MRPSRTSPVDPSIDTQSPSWTIFVSPDFCVTIIWPVWCSMRRTSHPTMQTLPICRATSAACDVMPPRAVRMPSAAFMPLMSSGLVSSRTRSTFSPRSAHSKASCAVKTTRPVAAPGPALSPCARSRPAASASFLAAGSKIGRRSWFSESGFTRRTAWSDVMRFSSTISTAMRTSANPVRLPVRVCSIQSLPRSTVNSMSCMSP